jgi:hypothetical protein
MRAEKQSPGTRGVTEAVKAGELLSQNTIKSIENKQAFFWSKGGSVERFDWREVMA